MFYGLCCCLVVYYDFKYDMLYLGMLYSPYRILYVLAYFKTQVAGSYGRWHKLECWRVPKKVQSGLTDPSDEAVSLRDLCAMEEVLLTGVAGLDDESKSLFTQHCMDSNNWAGRKRKAVAIMAEGTSAASESSGNFILVPGVDGAVGDNFLDGKTFVLTGTFPEVGGGDGHTIVKALVESFGGKAITRFSKTTSKYCMIYIIPSIYYTYMQLLIR